MNIDEVYRLKYLAGIVNKDGTSVEPESTSMENLSNIGSEKGESMRKNKIQPGTNEWFKLWFSQPKLTGEDPMPRKNK